VFDITFQDMDGERKYAWQTSWGVSTRLIGAIIMVHGDDAGLLMPPKVAPTQAVVIPIWRKEQEREEVAAFVDQLRGTLAGVRFQVDWDDQHTVGWKYNEWEMRGVPIRLEVGPRDVRNQQVVLVRRDNRNKEMVPLSSVQARVRELLTQIQQDMFEKARAFMAERTRVVNSFDEFKREIIVDAEGGRRAQSRFLLAGWCGSPECETKIKDETAATIRSIPINAEPEEGSCVWCGMPSHQRVVFGRSY